VNTPAKFVNQDAHAPPVAVVGQAARLGVDVSHPKRTVSERGSEGVQEAEVLPPLRRPGPGSRGSFWTTSDARSASVWSTWIATSRTGSRPAASST
jgi:hypothetical protein